jgi:DHA1 family bicyclomycin/chloramphenicol resistance-like MFS transporter
MSNTETAAIYRPSILLLVLIIATSLLAISIYIPSMPAIADDLSTSMGSVQLTLTLYLIGFAFSQLFYGPVSDRYGRRPALLSALFIFFVSSIACTLAPTIEFLIAARIVQAFGACAGVVLTRAIVRDVYNRTESARVMAYLGMAMGLAPALAPVLGGQLHIYFGWRASFTFMAVACAVAFVATWARLRETHNQRSSVATGLFGMLGGYVRLLRSPTYLGYAFNASFLTAGFFAFFSSAPIVVIQIMGMSPDQLGFLTLFMPFGFITGNFIVSRLTHRVSLDQLIVTGNLIAVVTMTIMVGIGLTGHISVAAIVGPVYFLGLANGFALPNNLAGAVSVDPSIAGTASALLGFMQMLMSAVATIAVGFLAHESQLTMASIMLVTAVGSISSRLFIRLDPARAEVA